MYACGIDVGTQNMAISFLSDKEDIITYLGSLLEMTRYELDKEIQIVKSEAKKSDTDYKAMIMILNKIPEFAYTSSVVIELQMSVNCAKMSRIDGIVFGFLCGKFPSMVVNLSSPVVRKKFITERITGTDMSELALKKSIKETKILSFQFVYAKFRKYYDYMQSVIGKLDDMCDSVVYASIARIR